MATPVKFRAEVTQVVLHAPDVATYEFRYLDRRPRYKPGQFLHLALDRYDPSGHWPQSRAFTIARGATDPGRLRLTIAAKGEFTRRILNELTPGRQVWMKAPYGEFLVDAPPQRETVLMAGGTGVTPFIAFLEDALVEGLQGELWLHYGARQADLLIFAGLVARCAAALPMFHTRLYSETAAVDGIVHGRIDLDSACRSLRSIAETVFYLCGPQAMINAFSLRLGRDYAVPKANIRVDQWQ